MFSLVKDKAAEDFDMIRTRSNKFLALKSYSYTISSRETLVEYLDQITPPLPLATR